MPNPLDLERKERLGMSERPNLYGYGHTMTPEITDQARKAAEKPFPIQSEYGYGPHPITVPWCVAEKAFAVYRDRYGTNQSIERIAERGGFGPSEMDKFYPTWKEEVSALAAKDKLIAELRREVEGLRANHQVGTCCICGSAIWSKEVRMSDERGEFHPLCAVKQERDKLAGICDEMATLIFYKCGATGKDLLDRYKAIKGIVEGSATLSEGE